METLHTKIGIALQPFILAVTKMANLRLSETDKQASVNIHCGYAAYLGMGGFGPCELTLFCY